MIPVFALLEGIGGPELMIIGILALLMFGSKRLPEVGRATGRAIREFKRATSGVEENLREVMRENPTPPKPRIRPPARPATPHKTPASTAAATTTTTTSAAKPPPTSAESTPATSPLPAAPTETPSAAPAASSPPLSASSPPLSERTEEYRD